MTPYKLKYSKDFQKLFSKLDGSVQKLIASYIKHNLENKDNPYNHGNAFEENNNKLWRYRVASYRLIVDIQDDELIILFLTFGHRKNINK